ncbi:MAG: hypothetical protein SNJ77_03540 [Cytophagales bacterium]
MRDTISKLFFIIIFISALSTFAQINPGDEDPDEEEPFEIPIDNGVAFTILAVCGYFVYQYKSNKSVETV